jgi:hypothetical protein
VHQDVAGDPDGTSWPPPPTAPYDDARVRAAADRAVAQLPPDLAPVGPELHAALLRHLPRGDNLRLSERLVATAAPPWDPLAETPALASVAPLRYGLSRTVPPWAQPALDSLSAQGIIRYLDGAATDHPDVHIHPLVIVRRAKGDGFSVRVTCDASHLNTLMAAYGNDPVIASPTVASHLEAFAGCTLFSQLDATKWFFQTPIAPPSQRLFGGVDSCGRVFVWQRMVMGAHCASGRAQTTFNKLLSNINRSGLTARAYADNLDIGTRPPPAADGAAATLLATAHLADLTAVLGGVCDI